MISLDEFIWGLEEVLEKQRDARDEMFVEQAHAHASQHNAATMHGSDKFLPGSTETHMNNNISNNSSHGPHVTPLELGHTSPDHHQGGESLQEASDARPRSRGKGIGAVKAKTVYSKGMVMMDEDLRAQLTVLCDDVIKAMKVSSFTPIDTTLTRSPSLPPCVSLCTHTNCHSFVPPFHHVVTKLPNDAEQNCAVFTPWHCLGSKEIYPHSLPSEHARVAPHSTACHPPSYP